MEIEEREERYGEENIITIVEDYILDNFIWFKVNRVDLDTY